MNTKVTVAALLGLFSALFLSSCQSPELIQQPESVQNVEESHNHGHSHGDGFYHLH